MERPACSRPPPWPSTVAGGGNRGGKRMADSHRSLHGGLLASLSGTLVVLSFSTPALTPTGPPLALLALAPLLLAARATDVRRAFALGWLAGVIAHVGVLHWVATAIARFEQTTAAAAVPFFAAFVAYQALQFALFAAGVAWTWRTAALGETSALARRSMAPCDTIRACRRRRGTR